MNNFRRRFDQNYIPPPKITYKDTIITNVEILSFSLSGGSSTYEINPNTLNYYSNITWPTKTVKARVTYVVENYWSDGNTTYSGEYTYTTGTENSNNNDILWSSSDWNNGESYAWLTPYHHGWGGGYQAPLDYKWGAVYNIVGANYSSDKQRLERNDPNGTSITFNFAPYWYDSSDYWTGVRGDTLWSVTVTKVSNDLIRVEYSTP